MSKREIKNTQTSSFLTETFFIMIHFGQELKDVLESLDDSACLLVLFHSGDTSLNLEITPKKWNIYSQCSVYNVNSSLLDLEIFLTRVQLQGNSQKLVIEGLGSYLVEQYSHSIDLKKLSPNLSFQPIYMLLSKLSDWGVTLTDPSEIWQAIQNVYLFVGKDSSWDLLVDQLNTGDVNGDDFLNMKQILDGFKLGEGDDLEEAEREEEGEEAEEDSLKLI